jgi:Spy/CpxP family protein refolding chaperone
MQRGWRGAALALAATVLLAGAAFAQGGGFFGGGGLMMLRMPEVQAELKLTDEQKTKVTDLVDRLMDERQGQFQELRDLSQEERDKRFAEWQASDEKKLGEILNADQLKRYKQLRYQRQGLSAVLQKPVSDQLKITAEQRTKIQAIVDTQREAMRSAFQNAGGDREAMRTKFEEMRKQTDEKIAAVLTDEQKKQWREMVGAPFTFPAIRLGA